MVGAGIVIPVWTFLASPRPEGVGGMLPLPWSLLSRRSGQICASHRLDFLPVSFSFLGSFGPAAQELLHRICRRFRTYARVAQWEAHAWVHRRLSFASMRGVADQFVCRYLASFGW